MSKDHGAMIVAIMKNEAPYIIEWVAHHCALGISDFLIFSGGPSNDGTELILERLDHLGYLHHLPNPKRILHQIPSWQVGALRYATQFIRYQDAKWILTIDADEFVQIVPGRHRLKDLFDATDPFDLMSFTVFGFNSDGHQDLGDGSVQSRFTRSIADISRFIEPDSDIVSSVKTIMRNPQPNAMFRNHRPKFRNFQSTNQTWVNGSGHKLPSEFTDHKVNSIKSGASMELARVNHYSIRSMDSFLNKIYRGDAIKNTGGEVDEKAVNEGIQYWNSRNNGLNGQPVKNYTPYGYKTIYNELRSDRILSELHERALHIHAETAKMVLETEQGQRVAEAMGYYENQER